MAKGIKSYLQLLLALKANQTKVMSKQSDSTTQVKKVELEIKNKLETENTINLRVISNTLQKLAYIGNQNLKQNALNSGNQMSFYKALIQFLSGDTDNNLDAFRVLGVRNKNQIELNTKLQSLLKDDKDGITFIAKLLSSSFEDKDTNLIKKFSPLQIKELNEVGKWFAVKNTDGEHYSLSTLLLGFLNKSGNFRD